MSSIVVRPGTPTDSGHAKGLIYDSSHELMNFMFGGRDAAEFVLGKLFRLERGHFSHRFSTVAMQESSLVGIQLGYDQQQLAKQELTGAALLLVHSRMSRWWHLLTKAGPVLDKYVPKPTNGMYYINNIAISKSSRGAGIGKHLLHHTIATAKSIGYRGVELDVTSANTGAIQFYQKQGFSARSTSGDKKLLERYQLPPLVRMTLAI